MTPFLLLSLAGCWPMSSTLALPLPSAAHPGDTTPTLSLPAVLPPGLPKGAFSLGFVLLHRAGLPDPDTLTRRLAAFGVGAARPTDTSETMQTWALPDEVSLVVMSMGAPHPDAGRMATGPMTPTAEAAAAAPAHAIVVVSGLGGSASAQDGQLARILAAVAASCPSLAVMLGHGCMFYRTDVFVAFVDSLRPGGFPTEVCVDVTVAREPDGRISMLTHGLVRYGREEFYVLAPSARANDAFDMATMMARWMIADPAKQLPTGETVGRSETEKIRVHRVGSPAGAGPDVIRLEL